MLFWLIICTSTYQWFDTQEYADSKFADDALYMEQHNCKQPFQASIYDADIIRTLDEKRQGFGTVTEKSDKEPEKQVEPSRNPANLSEDSHCRFDFVPVGYRTVKFTYYCQ